jgi:UPF0042 nucleotide-binding protein
MPVMLLPKFLELRAGSGSEIQKLALGMDLRQKEFAANYPEVFDRLRNEGYLLEIVFLEATEEALLKRYSQTRRQHPVDRGHGLIESIRSERDQLAALRKIADKIIDTSHYTVHQLKEVILHHARGHAKLERLHVDVLSFGFKYGVPLEADLIVDVRFIPNPHFIPGLKELDGLDERVRHYVRKWPETLAFLEKYLSLLDFLVPLYEKESKSYLTIAVGCTGGRHRSVVVAREVFEHLKQHQREITLTHRDIELV